VSRISASLFFVSAGISHFLMPEFFERIVPPQLPSPRAIVAVSGLAEIAGGIGVLIPKLRRAAGWGLIALLVAVFPANIYMAGHRSEVGTKIPQSLLWLRLPFQFVFLAWVWSVALRREGANRGSGKRR
jgi:uncharacterized membrane protein